MSLGNDPSRVSKREPEPQECRHCNGRTHAASRVCPDCRYEGVGPTTEPEDFESDQ